MTKTQTPTKPRTPILEWSAEALHTLATLKGLVETAEANKAHAKDTYRRMNEIEGLDPLTVKWAMTEWEDANRALGKAQSRLSDLYNHYSAE
jgi:hypothetical protein